MITTDAYLQISGEDLVTVKEFKYLGSIATYNNKLDTELRLRKSKASQAFGCLKDKSLVQQRSYNQDQMCCLFCHCDISSTIQSRILDSVHGPSSQFECLHDEAPEANPIKSDQNIPNQDILMKTNMSSMYETLIHCNLRWAGHLIRFDSTRLPKQILYSQLKEGHRSVGRPKLHIKDTII